MTIVDIEPKQRLEEARSNQSTHKELNLQHRQHCCGTDISKKQRGLNREWIEANCRSLNQQEATELLRYPARSGGNSDRGSKCPISTPSRQAVGWKAREESTKV